MKPPPAPTLIRALATVLFMAGIVTMTRAGKMYRRNLASIQQATTQLETLVRLENQMAAARLPTTPWEDTGTDSPIAWRSFARELDLANAVEVRESEHEMLRAGWIMRRADLTAQTLQPREIVKLIDQSQALPHPWRLVAATLRANHAGPNGLNVRLRFETPVRSP